MKHRRVRIASAPVVVRVIGDRAPLGHRELIERTARAPCYPAAMIAPAVLVGVELAARAVTVLAGR